MGRNSCRFRSQVTPADKNIKPYLLNSLSVSRLLFWGSATFFISAFYRMPVPVSGAVFFWMASYTKCKHRPFAPGFIRHYTVSFYRRWAIRFTFMPFWSSFDGRQQRVWRPSNDGCDGRRTRCWRPSNDDWYLTIQPSNGNKATGKTSQRHGQ